MPGGPPSGVTSGEAFSTYSLCARRLEGGDAAEPVFRAYAPPGNPAGGRAPSLLPGRSRAEDGHDDVPAGEGEDDGDADRRFP